jgi:hypothetical protein
MNNKTNIDWDLKQAVFEGKTISQIRNWIETALADLPRLRQYDREMGTGVEGYTCDELSIARKVMNSKINDQDRTITIKVSAYERDLIEDHRNGKL